MGDDLSRLAFAIVGIGIQLMLTRDVIDSIGPHLLHTPAAVDQWSARLVDYAEAMVSAEKARMSAAQERLRTPRRAKNNLL